MSRRVLAALLLIVLIVISTVPLGAYTAGETLKSFGAISGDQYGNLNEGMKLNRAEMAVLLASLNGRSAEAKNFKLRSTFSDVPSNTWYAPYVAYAEAMGWSKGVGGGKYAPTANVTVKEAAAFLMNALGKKYSYATVIDEAKKAGIKNGLTGDGAILRKDVFAAMLDALYVTPEGKSESLGIVLGYFKAPVVPAVVPTVAPISGPTEVKAAEVATIKSLRVTFVSEVADRTKISFVVKRLATPIPVTVTWNEAKNSVLLASDWDLLNGVYEVKVLENNQEIASKSVLIEDRHVGRIEVVSPSVNVLTMPTMTRGYAAYRVYDQYGEDITLDTKASGLVFSSTAGTAQGGSGAMVIAPFSDAQPLALYTGITIAILDPKTGIAATATLPVGTSVSPLSEIKLNPIGAVQNGSSECIYISYQAFDSFGLATKNYDVISAGLLDLNNLGLADGTVDLISHSNASGIKVEVVKDDIDQSKAVIKLTPGNAALAADMTETIAATTKSGKVSSITVKVVK